MNISYVVEFGTIDINSINAFERRQISKDDYESLLESEDKVEWINTHYAFEWALDNKYCTAFYDQWLIDKDSKYSQFHI